MNDYYENEYSPEEFDRLYGLVKEEVLCAVTTKDNKCAIILGGQPGSGKSSYYLHRTDLLDYAKIDGDSFRLYHPNIKQIVKSDAEHMAERTQKFANSVVERLISDLSTDGYNLVIEGTLRNPETPINTCKKLITKGYNPELVVIACDAEQSWLSTIERAKTMEKNKLPVRLVPIDTFNYTVNNIVHSLNKIYCSNCFSEITILNRDGEELYNKNSSITPDKVLAKHLNLDNWNDKFPYYQEQFIITKIELLEKQLKLNNNHGLSL